MSDAISYDDGRRCLNWLDLTRAIEAGHRLPRAQVNDSFLHRGADTLLIRSAWIDGLGSAVKSTTVYPGNPARGRPSIHGVMTLYADENGAPEMQVDFDLVTHWKTAGDSLLGALKLARPDSRNILVIGAGPIARNLIAAYGAGFPGAEISLWNRTRARAEALVADLPHITVADDLEPAVRAADIVSSATMATAPFIGGAWLRPGQHLDLVGAFRPDMREVDDDALRRARIFLDSFDTTLGHIGEIQDPLDRGVITRADILGDYYDLDSGTYCRRSDNDITLFKNGGGAHLDLITGRYILDAWRAAQ